MGWFIAWVVLGLFGWGAMALLMAAVPSSETASNRDVLTAGALSFGCSAIILAVAYAIWSIFVGIF